MSDIATVWSVERAAGDWLLSGGDLAAGDDLATAVLISLFTDRVAGPDDAIPDGSDDPRGWWGDVGRELPIGSKIWLRARSKQTQATLDLVRDDAIEALDWLIRDGVAGSVDVQAEWLAPRLLALTVTVFRKGLLPRTYRYDWAWQNQGVIDTPETVIALPPGPPALSQGGVLDFSDPANSGLIF